MGTCRICGRLAFGSALCGKHERVAYVGGLVVGAVLSDWTHPQTPPDMRVNHHEMMTDPKWRGATTWREELRVLMTDLHVWLDDGPTESGATAA